MSHRSATGSRHHATETSAPSGAGFDVRERKTVAALVATDAVGAAAATALALAGTAAFGVGPSALGALVVAAFVALDPLANTLFGLYPGVAVDEVEEFRRLTLANVAAWLVLMAALVMWDEPSGLAAAALGMVLAWILLPYARFYARNLFRGRPWWGIPVIVIGAGSRAEAVVRHMRRHPTTLKRPVAVLAEEQVKPESTLHGVPVLGGLEHAKRFRSAGVRHVLIATTATPDDLEDRLRGLDTAFPNVMVAPDELPKLHVERFAIQIGGVLQRPERAPRRDRIERVFKRALDLVLLVPTGLIAAPIVGVAALIIRLVDPGEPFYTQERIGRDGERFEVIKLRTMYMDAEDRLAPYLASNPEARAEWKRSYKLRNDPRILTGIGDFLRASSLDELPQLWNIAKGDMSFIGPRPFPDYHLEAFSDEFRELRIKVKPGLTGLWQISARSDADVDLQQELDSAYILHWSFWLDLLILLRTPEAVLTGRGAR